MCFTYRTMFRDPYVVIASRPQQLLDCSTQALPYSSLYIRFVGEFVRIVTEPAMTSWTI